ncbi:MAG: hypothetical protein ACI9UV_002978 [Algoriphagus sp.]|jgi:hypothetical protein
MIISSCIPEPESPKFEVSENSQLMKVREWFEENKTKLRLPERGSNFRTDAQELILPFFEKEPDWDQFHHYYFPDGREVFEINLENVQTYISISDASEDVATQANRSIQNILFVKHPTENRFDPLIARYYPNEESSKREFKEISYQMIDEKWSGWIDLFTYDEHYFIGFQVEKGQITHTRTFKQEGQDAKKAIGFENKDVRCALVTTDWLNITVAGNVVTITGLNSTTSQSCGMGSYDSGSQSNGSPSYNYGGFPSSGVGSSGAPSGYPVPEDVPLPKLTIEIDYSITSNARVDCIVKKLAMSSFVKSIAEFTNTTEVPTNSVLKLGPITNATANGQTLDMNGYYNITLNANKISNMKSLEIARTILHELVHAEIFATLKEKGKSPLDDNFPANLDQYIALYLNTDSRVGDKHHNYMATTLLPRMGSELMEIHKTQFPEEFQRFNEYVKGGGYPKGLSVDFYMNMFWGGMEGSVAFEQLKAITTYSPLLSPYDKYKRDIELVSRLTQNC